MASPQQAGNGPRPGNNQLTSSTRRYTEPDIQYQLAQIWERVLGIERVGIHDNYFDLGGDSVKAVQIIVEIEELSGRQLPLVTFLEAPTIAGLARLLRDSEWKPHWRSLVPIKTTGSRPPFYCVHGVGGNVLSYLDFARYMHPDQPFYGIQAIGLDGKGPRKNLTVEEMASHYLHEIRDFQPKGPYYLGGSSFGGLVAFEMARQLHAMDEQVALLALFDTAGPGYPKYLPTTTRWRSKWNRLRFRAGLHWSNLLVTEPRKRPQYIWLKVIRWRKALANRARMRRDDLKRWLKLQVNRLFWPEAIHKVQRACHWAAGDYIPGPYAGRVTLFRATEQPRGIVPDPTLGWGPLAKDFQIYDTPGYHGAIAVEPRVAVLAQQLEDALSKAVVRIPGSQSASAG